MSDTLGKMDRHFFEDFIKGKCGTPRTEVLVGPGFGVDVSIVELAGDMAMALTSDPLSLIPTLGLSESAWLSVHLLANDMATTGFAPMYGQFVLNLPSRFSKQDFRAYWDYIHRFCDEIGTAITGGHTGFVEGQDSTIAGGGTFITIAPKKDIRVSKFSRPGDAILVTKSCGISSAAILAMSFPDTVKNKAGMEVYDRGCESFYQTSSLKEALAVMKTAEDDITAMHDVTEGGVLGAIYEMAAASGNGALILDDSLPIGHIQKEICAVFSLDPRHCIGAGSMIITCKPGKEAKIIENLKEENIACTKVGEMTEKEGIDVLKNGKKLRMEHNGDDPYWEAFFKAYDSGWE